MIPALYPDLLLILPEIVILLTGSIILINGVTTRSYNITHIISLIGASLALIIKFALIYIYCFVYENN